MSIKLGLLEISIGVVLLSTLQFFVTLWITERLKASLQKENAKFVEKIRWDLKVREQAERVAEYMAMASDLKETDNEDTYRRANQLNWELAMWLPEDLYKAMVSAIALPNDPGNNPLSVVVAIRKYLLDTDEGELTSDNIAHHAPGIGSKAPANKTLDAKT
jgi:hypothetical protein